ncbi:RICIN domain-containing protein [Kribbella sp. CA-294648]|uniref:RICIN domain-containing protein n=1 Tax=Kribbella sp. CA-294648 TaxID=3239948 RepID=UPI003D8C468C
MFKKKLRRAIAIGGMFAVAAVGTATTVPASAAGTAVDSTTTSMLVLRHSGKAITVSDWWKSNPVNVEQQTYQGWGTQKFKHRYFADGHFSLVDTSWWQGCLDVENDSGSDGARIISKACDGTPSQKWDYTPNPDNLNYVYLRNVNSGLYVTLVTGSVSNGTKFVQRVKNGYTIQQFSKTQL